MKKAILSVLFVAAAVCFSACSSFEIGSVLNEQRLSTDPNVRSVAHVNGEVWGVYFFGLPMFSGSVAQPGRCVLFHDTVTVNNAVNMVTRESRAKLNGQYVVDLESERTSAWIFPLLFFWYQEIQVSGNVLQAQ